MINTRLTPSNHKADGSVSTQIRSTGLPSLSILPRSLSIPPRNPSIAPTRIDCEFIWMMPIT